MSDDSRGDGQAGVLGTGVPPLMENEWTRLWPGAGVQEAAAPTLLGCALL